MFKWITNETYMTELNDKSTNLWLLSLITLSEPKQTSRECVGSVQPPAVVALAAWGLVLRAFPSVAPFVDLAVEGVHRKTVDIARVAFLLFYVWFVVLPIRPK